MYASKRSEFILLFSYLFNAFDFANPLFSYHFPLLSYPPYIAGEPLFVIPRWGNGRRYFALFKTYAFVGQSCGQTGCRGGSGKNRRNPCEPRVVYYEERGRRSAIACAYTHVKCLPGRACAKTEKLVIACELQSINPYRGLQRFSVRFAGVHRAIAENAVGSKFFIGKTWFLLSFREKYSRNVCIIRELLVIFAEIDLLKKYNNYIIKLL